MHHYIIINNTTNLIIKQLKQLKFYCAFMNILTILYTVFKILIPFLRIVSIFNQLFEMMLNSEYIYVILLKIYQIPN